MGTWEIHQKWPNLKKNRTCYRIPVSFHRFFSGLTPSKDLVTPGKSLCKPKRNQLSKRVDNVPNCLKKRMWIEIQDVKLRFQNHNNCRRRKKQRDALARAESTFVYSKPREEKVANLIELAPILSESLKNTLKYCKNHANIRYYIGVQVVFVVLLECACLGRIWH